MSTLEKLQLLAEAVIIGLLLYLAFLKAYFQEKGKNLATKEDIQEMTSLVESVKSQLQYSLQAKLSLRAEEHDALIDYFTKYSVWLSAISNFTLTGVNKDNVAKLSEIRSQLDTCHRDVDLAASKMQLFTNNAEILAQHGELMVETLKFGHHAQLATFEFEEIYLEAKHVSQDTPSTENLERFSSLLSKSASLYQQFQGKQLEMLEALYPRVQQQRLSIANHIRSLIQE